MINVLPEEGKKWIRGEYRLRLATLTLLAVAFVALALAALLFPSYRLSESTYAQAHTEREAFSQALSPANGEKVIEELSRAENMRQALALRVEEQAPSLHIEGIVRAQAKSEGVTLARLAYESAEEISVRLSGFAKTRENLIAFSEMLERIAEVKSVKLPVSNLTRSVNITFNMTVTFTQL